MLSLMASVTMTVILAEEDKNKHSTSNTNSTAAASESKPTPQSWNVDTLATPEMLMAFNRGIYIDPPSTTKGVMNSSLDDEITMHYMPVLD